jgi:hypothetical protein
MKKYRGKGRRNFDRALHYLSLLHHGERKDANRKGGGPRYDLQVHCWPQITRLLL